MSNKLQSSQKYQKVAAEFFSEARGAWCDSREKQSAGFRAPYWMHNNLVFAATPNLATSERTLRTTCLELLGARATSREALREIIWELVEASLGEADQKAASKVFVRNLAERAHTDSTTEWLYIRPNYLIRFADKLKAIKVGPVTAAVAAKAIAEIEARKVPDLNVTFQIGKEFKHDPKLGTPLPGIIELPPVVWMVTTSTTQGLVEQEARWRVDVATSLLRLFYPRSRHFPRPGELETDPFVKPLFDNEGIKVGKNNIFGGGWGMPNHYIVDASVAKVTRTAKFRSLASALFQANKGTVGECVSRALGWLSRARQAQDPAERFLFLFTSIEALLSSQSEAVPITQTIARHAAVMLANKVANRQEISDLLQRLYGERSALIHRGSREVNSDDVNTAQVLAESLCLRTLRRVDLRLEVSKFESTLRSASFGTKWKMP